MQGNIPAFSNVVISAGGSLTVSAGDTNLNLAVLEDMVIASGGVLNADAKGYSQMSGPGAGSTLSNQGSGGGYGGTGGAAASGAVGGSAYGSASQPIQRGSGGGTGSGTAIGGSEGGGAIRLTVAGQLTLDGLLSAKGGDGLQDNSGGGSGGSIWLSTRKLAGAGQIAAIGGGGELYNGGGGGGGRIALYSLANAFTGEVSIAGAMGAMPGNTGTVFAASSWPGLAIISNSPAGVVSNVVSQLTLEFNAAVNPATAAPNDFVIVTPNGPLLSTNLTLFLPGPNTLQLSFPPLNVPGNYRIEAGPALEDFFGQPMSQVYTGAFSIAVPLISGPFLTPTASLWPA